MLESLTPTNSTLKHPADLSAVETPASPRQGAHFRGNGVEYVVWAPICETVEVEIQGLGGDVLRRVPLAIDPESYARGFDEQGKPGDRYRFRLDGQGSWPDPASRYQPDGVHAASCVVDPQAFAWRNDAGWNCPPLRDLVLYELHLGAFTSEGTFRAAIERLPYLRDLGVSALEIMPIGDFAGERNWGYDGVCLYAPAHAYGHPDDLRALVDAAHGLGLAVILDVVYNHFGPDGNYLGLYIGEYLDEKQKTPWGGAIRYGDLAFHGLRELVCFNPVYWMREFHIDGFRLDATHAIYDPSPRHLLKEITAAVHAEGGFVIAEDSRNDSRVILPEDLGGYGFDGVWADDLHHSMRVANTREQQSYFGDFEGSLHELIETLQHGWFYRGQYTRRKSVKRGSECRHLPPERFIHCISNHDQIGNKALGDRLSDSISPGAYRASSALLCLTPYTPLLFMGQEWAASTPFLFFTEHNDELGRLIAIGRRDEFKDFAEFKDPAIRARIPNPQDIQTFTRSKLIWSELENTPHAGCLELYREFLQLRRGHAAFRPPSRSQWQLAEESGLGLLRLHDAGGDWLILFDLVGGHETVLSHHSLWAAGAGERWRPVLSSNETRFGGSGAQEITHAGRVNFQEPEVAVLRLSRLEEP